MSNFMKDRCEGGCLGCLRLGGAEPCPSAVIAWSPQILPNSFDCVLDWDSPRLIWIDWISCSHFWRIKPSKIL